MKNIDEKYFKNPEQYIPPGCYCNNCIFLDKDETKPSCFNGYCHYIKRGDWNHYAESEIGDIPECYSGLLWDGVKMCGVKDYSEWCLDCQHFEWINDKGGICDITNSIMHGEECCDSFIPKDELL